MLVRETLVAWANLVARASHGGMAGWDPWATTGGEGAVALQGARVPTRDHEDPTGGNVDPKAMDDALMVVGADTSGVLEIAIDGAGRLIRGTEYGMHLRGVGTKVVKELRGRGAVRTLRVNKLVRMYEPSEASWRMVASVLITADGYVRRTNWGEFAKVVMPQGATSPLDAFEQKRDCFDDLIHGHERADCHMDEKANERDIAAFAEKAQSLSLVDLEAT
jgi:hypothetical protein